MTSVESKNCDTFPLKMEHVLIKTAIRSVCNRDTFQFQPLLDATKIVIIFLYAKDIREKFSNPKKNISTTEEIEDKLCSNDKDNTL